MSAIRSDAEDSLLMDRAFSGSMNVSDASRPYFTPTSLAEYLAITERAVFGMIDKGLIQAWFTPGGVDLRIFGDDVDAYLEGLEAAERDRAVPEIAPRPGSYEKWTPDERAYAAILLRDPCSYCGGRMEAIDHIAPRAGGGAHRWENLTAACQRCNSVKGVRPLLIFLLRRRP